MAYEKMVEVLRDEASIARAADGIRIVSAEALNAIADAIEELSRHYCPHAVHNVHNRGDDSLCLVLRAEPPKEETDHDAG